MSKFIQFRCLKDVNGKLIHSKCLVNVQHIIQVIKVDIGKCVITTSKGDNLLIAEPYCFVTRAIRNNERGKE